MVALALRVLVPESDICENDLSPTIRFGQTNGVNFVRLCIATEVLTRSKVWQRSSGTLDMPGTTPGRPGKEVRRRVPFRSFREGFLRTCNIHCSVVVVLLAVHLTSSMDKGRGKDPSGRGLLR